MEVVAYTVLTIALLIGALALALAVYIRIALYRQTHRAIRLMRQRERFLPRTAFEQHVANSTGTVLFEYPTLGWSVLRVWWTPEDVLARARAAGISEQSPEPAEGEPSPFEIWCHNNYTDLQSGRACIAPFYIFGSAFHNFAKSLRNRFPDMPSAMVHSALVDFIRTK